MEFFSKLTEDQSTVLFKWNFVCCIAVCVAIGLMTRIATLELTSFEIANAAFDLFWIFSLFWISQIVLCFTYFTRGQLNFSTAALCTPSLVLLVFSGFLVFNG